MRNTNSKLLKHRVSAAKLTDGYKYVTVLYLTVRIFSLSKNYITSAYPPSAFCSSLVGVCCCSRAGFGLMHDYCPNEGKYMDTPSSHRGYPAPAAIHFSSHPEPPLNGSHRQRGENTPASTPGLSPQTQPVNSLHAVWYHQTLLHHHSMMLSFGIFVFQMLCLLSGPGQHAVLSGLGLRISSPDSPGELCLCSWETRGAVTQHLIHVTL